MDFKASKLLGVYEFYYSAGFLYGRAKIKRPEALPGAEEVLDVLSPMQGSMTEERAAYLLSALLGFPTEDLDASGSQDDLMALFDEGLSDGINYG